MEHTQKEANIYEEEIMLEVDGQEQLLKYTLSNSIEMIEKSIYKRTGISVPSLYEVDWKVNTGLSPMVKNLMKKYNVNYSMTTLTLENTLGRHLFINRRVIDKWFIFTGAFFEDKFYSSDEFVTLLSQRQMEYFEKIKELDKYGDFRGKS